MKNTLYTLAILGATTFSASAGTALVATAPVPTPAAAPAPMNSAFELDAVAAIADNSEAPDLWGFRLGYALYSETTNNITHEFNVGLGFMWGSEDIGYGESVSEFDMPLLFGYNLNYAINEATTVYAGAKVGLSYVSLSVEDLNDSDCSFVWAIGCGVKRDITANMYAKLGYDFTRVYSELCLEGDTGSYARGQHVISLGLGYQF